MFAANPLLQLVPARLPQVINRVRAAVWTTVADVADIAATEPGPEHRPLEQAQSQPLTPVAGPHHYGKLWDQRWFRLRLPQLPAGSGPLFLHWRDQAEATLFLDGEPHYGFDVAHRHAPIPRATREAWIESVVCQTGIWHREATGLDPEGSRFEGAQVAARNEEAWTVLHDFLVLEDLMREELRAAFGTHEGEFGGIGTKPQLGRLPPLLRRLLRHLDDAANAFDTGGLRAARRALAAAYRDLPGYGAPPAAVLTGHAHIDLVWLWPERVGEFKAVHTFATANRLMEHYPEFCFGYTQTASYAAVERRSPAMMRAVRRRLRERRWEALGATEVESDTVLACGEALARSFLLGQEGFRRLNGRPSPVLWLPDVFGYSGCLPQMMRETGVTGFFTTKLTWNAITAFPYSSFRWQGSDGSEVVAHLCQNNGYNQTVSAGELRRGAEAHRQCDVHREFLAPTGYGDGGGGVTEEMCERARRVASLAGVPAAQWGRIDDFFARLEAIRDRLPVYRGELYFEYHRGTYTTHGAVKARFRAAERALQAQEAAHCARGVGPVDPAPWRRIVFAQFHDYIPGSSIHEVYDEGIAEHTAIAASALERAAATLTSADGEPALFNPLPLPRRHWHEGRLLELPPLGGAPIAALAARAAAPVRASARRLASDRVDARFDASGRITGLTVDGHAVPFAAPAGELWLFDDHPHLFEAWDIDRQALSCGRPDARRARVSVETEGPGRAAVAFTRPLGQESSITVRYSLEAGNPVLGIRCDVDWRERKALLKMVFPTRFLGRDARFGSPYGSVRRAQLGGPPAAEAMWEVPMSRWCMVTDDNESEGLMLVTEAKYGVSCRDGALGLSLVRSAKITSESRGAQRGSHPQPIRRTLAPDVLSDLGRHEITFAVGRFHAAAPVEEHPAALADLLFTPPVAYHGDAVSAGFLGLEGAPSLLPAWAVPGDGGAWTLRLHETLGRGGVATVRHLPGWRLRRTNLAGEDLGGLQDGRLEFKPYQIASVRFEPAVPRAESRRR